MLASSCALRPRYRDFVTATTEGSAVKLLMTDANGLPLENAKIELSEAKSRQSLSTAADGTVSLPVDKKYLDENPVLVVQLPPGAKSYSLALAPPPAPPPLPDVAPPDVSTLPVPPAPEPAAPEPAPTTPAPAPGTTP